MLFILRGHPFAVVGSKDEEDAAKGPLAFLTETVSAPWEEVLENIPGAGEMLWNRYGISLQLPCGAFCSHWHTRGWVLISGLCVFILTKHTEPLKGDSSTVVGYLWPAIISPLRQLTQTCGRCRYQRESAHGILNLTHSILISSWKCLLLHSSFKDQLPETHVDINTPRNPFTWVTDSVIHFVDPHWPMWQQLEMCLVWIQKLCVERVYIGFQNIVKTTKSLHNFIMLITQQCFFFPQEEHESRRGRSQGKWTH